MKSISLPIIIGSTTVLLTVALLVVWTWVIVHTPLLPREAAQNTWVVVAGIVSFGVVMTMVTILSIFLSREILVVRRQHTFIDSVTHELKSPLASLKLCLETLQRPELSDEQRVQ